MKAVFTLLWKTALLRLLPVALVSVAWLGVHATAQTWSLTTAQRQAYLNYYAPVILKRADENNNKQGRDWITNFDFDQDNDFSNNRVNWLNVPNYVNASANGPSAYDRWRIRPTLYTAIIEYMDNGTKSLVLFYHVFNATDKDAKDIHDWERVEILVNNVTGTPGGAGEYVNHVVATMHKEQLIRRYYDAGGLNFMSTATGKHILIWQADESDWDWYTGTDYGYHAHALQHVETPYSTIASVMNSSSTDAKLAVNESDSKNVHYVFVPEASQAAVDTWRAKPLTYTTASGLASRVDNGDSVRWTSTKRITYELQDVADIFPTQYQGNAWYPHWQTKEQRYILLESPILNEAGQAEVPAGMQLFNLWSRDIGKSNYEGTDSSLLAKNPIWGNYSVELNSEFSVPEFNWTGDEFGGFAGTGVDSFGRTRGAASGYLNSHNSFWWQHDFFVHSGAITSDQTHFEAGMWLPGAWYTAANGGFDGRWVQLFDDRTGLETFSELSLSVTHPPNRCGNVFYVTAKATGGLSPYTFTWVNATPVSPSYAPTNMAEMTMGSGSVTVQSADGQTRTYSIRVPINCTGTGGGGGVIP
jgi:hypothetical protein